MSAAPAGQRLAWQGFAFDLPPGWEVVGYALGHPARGQFRCAERLRQAGALVWSRYKERPDPRRVMAEIEMRQAEAEKRPAAAFEHRTIGEFTLAVPPSGLPAQACAWLAERRLLLHWTFPGWAGDLLEREIAPLLASYAHGDAGGEERSLLGLRCRLPAAFLHEDLLALPGNVRLEMAGPKRLRVAVRRLAVPEAWLRGDDVGGLYRRLLFAEGAAILAIEEASFRGHPAARIRFKKRGGDGFDLLLGRRWLGDGLMWWDRDERRIFAIEQLGPRRAPRLELAEAIPLAQERRPSGPAGPPSSTSGFGQQLASVPLRNAQARTVSDDGSHLVLELPIVHRGVGRWLARPLRLRNVRQTALSELGRIIYLRLDGTASIGDLVAWMETEHRLGFHEARALTLNYLRLLAERGLVAVGVPAATTAPSDPVSPPPPG